MGWLEQEQVKVGTYYGNIGLVQEVEETVQEESILVRLDGNTQPSLRQCCISSSFQVTETRAF